AAIGSAVLPLRGLRDREESQRADLGALDAHQPRALLHPTRSRRVAPDAQRRGAFAARIRYPAFRLTLPEGNFWSVASDLESRAGFGVLAWHMTTDTEIADRYRT